MGRSRQDIASGMAATSPADASPVAGPSPISAALRLGHESTGAGGEWSVQWRLRRNCSLAPRQLLCCYAALCVLSLAVASAFWWAGVRLVMPFTWLELLAVGAALLAYARHAVDGESITLDAARLTVEHAWGNRVERTELRPHSVRVAAGAEPLVELSGPGGHVAVGRYLRSEQRRQLAAELRAALRRVPPVTGGAAGEGDGTGRTETRWRRDEE
jgi:uncharacterized membrane protein